MKCLDCKFWKAPDKNDEYASKIDQDFGVCSKIAFREDIGGWDDDYKNWTIRAEYADLTAVCADGSGYHAKVLTKPEHFCSMFSLSDAIRAMKGKP